MLIQQLREMEADGIVRREVFHQVPPKVEYSVTEPGASLNHALAALADWGEEHAKRMPSKSAGTDSPAKDRTRRQASRP